MINSILKLIFFTLFSVSEGLDYIQYDQAESQDLVIFDFSSSSLVSLMDEYVINSIQFNNYYSEVPQVLLSITQLDINIGSPVISISNSLIMVTNSQFILSTAKYGYTKLFGIHLYYLVILSKNVVVQNFNLTYSSIGTPVQFKLPASGSKQRQAQCFITGFHFTEFEGQSISYGVSVKGFTQTSYIIQISANFVNRIQYMLVNCIEYYQENYGAYFMLADSQSFSLGNTLLTQSNSPQNINAVINSNYDNSCSNILSFIAITKITQIQVFDDVLRFTLTVPLYLNYQQQIQLKTWNLNQLMELETSFFQIQMYNCNKNESTNIYNLSDQNVCVESCPDSYYGVTFYTALICSPCSQQCATCMSSATLCTSCISGFYLDSNNLCQPCDESCVECVTSSTHCLSCLPNQILSNNRCYLFLGCDLRMICQFCILGNCIQCLAQYLPTCVTPCPIGHYYFNAQCSASQASNTNCNRFQVCTSCMNSSCQVCSKDLYKCTSCLNNGFLFLKNCYQNQPYSTYCDSSNTCTQCLNQSCVTCDSTLKNCLSCLSQDILHNNSCYSQGVCNIQQQSCTYCYNGNCVVCQNNNLQLECQ